MIAAINAVSPSSARPNLPGNRVTTKRHEQHAGQPRQPDHASQPHDVPVIRVPEQRPPRLGGEQPARSETEDAEEEEGSGLGG